MHITRLDAMAVHCDRFAASLNGLYRETACQLMSDLLALNALKAV